MGLFTLPEITYKPPKTRKEQEFAIYPFQPGDTQISLQSDNYCIIVDLKHKKMYTSKRFNQYPRFQACLPKHGGTVSEIAPEIQHQLVPILKGKAGGDQS